METDNNSKFIKSRLIDMTPTVKENIMACAVAIGKELVPERKNSPGFILTPELDILYRDLIDYFTGNEGVYDPSKCIYLFGSYGIGKTITMQIFSKLMGRYFSFSGNGYSCTSTENMAAHYKLKGNLSYYGRRFENNEYAQGDNRYNIRKLKSFNLCINEFGKPLNEKFYGSDVQDIFNSTMMIRYELYQEHETKTHTTSNFHPEKLNCFDDALLNRFKEMHEFIEFEGECFRG